MWWFELFCITVLSGHICNQHNFLWNLRCPTEKADHNRHHNMKLYLSGCHSYNFLRIVNLSC
ncbi:unnamed protein product, partial [Hymenolepis diminuta]